MIGSLTVGATTCASDTCLMTTSHIGTQTAMYLAQNYANRERYEFSNIKTKVLLYKSKLSRQEATYSMPFELNGSTEHLGIQRSEAGKPKETITMRIQVGICTSSKMMGAGICGLSVP